MIAGPSDARTFLADFGELAMYDDDAVMVIFDQPGADILAGRLANNQYQMTYATGDLPALVYGTQLFIRSAVFKVIATNAIDDAVFSRAILEEA